MDAWQFYLAEYDKLRGMCSKVSKSFDNKIDIDELMSEIAYRAVDIFRQYNPDYGASIRTHFYVNAKWYIYKYCKAACANEAQDRIDETPEYINVNLAELDESFDRIENLELIKSVLHKIAIVNPYYRNLLVLRFLCGLTYQEIGYIVNRNPRVVSRNVQHALAAAREALYKCDIMRVRCSNCGAETYIAQDTVLDWAIQVVCEKCNNRALIIKLDSEDNNKRAVTVSVSTTETSSNSNEPKTI